MSSVFYDYLIKLEEVEEKITSLGLPSLQKEELSQMIDQSLHYLVTTAILDHLPKEYHQAFLEKFHEMPFESTLINFLTEKIPNIELLVTSEIETFKETLLQDLSLI